MERPWIDYWNDNKKKRLNELKSKWWWNHIGYNWLLNIFPNSTPFNLSEIEKASNILLNCGVNNVK